MLFQVAYRLELDMVDKAVNFYRLVKVPKEKRAELARKLREMEVPPLEERGVNETLRHVKPRSR